VSVAAVSEQAVEPVTDIALGDVAAAHDQAQETSLRARSMTCGAAGTRQPVAGSTHRTGRRLGAGGGRAPQPRAHRGGGAAHGPALADLRVRSRRTTVSDNPSSGRDAPRAWEYAAQGEEHRSQARDSLDAALAIFEELGADLWAARSRAEITRLGGRRARDRDALTETERRIAGLAAEGRLNREIARELFVPSGPSKPTSRAHTGSLACVHVSRRSRGPGPGTSHRRS
jgi:hypothetical protein